MRKEWPLTGRREELAVIDALLDSNEPAGLVIAGEAGVGTSRLVTETLDRAERRGRATARVVASSSLASLPFGAVAHVLPVDIGEHDNVLRRAVDALVGDAERIVVGVDDAHLLDAASAALLHHLVAHRRGTVVATVRRGTPAPDSIAALWTSGLARRLELGPLSRAETDELTAAALGGPLDGITRRTLWRATQGHAMLLHELVVCCRDSGLLAERDGVWHLDASFAQLPRLADLVTARVGQVTTAERAALELVAEAEPLELCLAERLVDADALATLERRGLLVTREDRRRTRVSLSHRLYAEVIRSRTPILRARVLQRELAGALAATGARRGEDVLRLATWRLRAGMVEDPAALVAGAHRAGAVGDHVLAERLAQAAVDAGGGLPALRSLSEAVLGQGRLADAAALADELTVSGDSAAERAQAATAALNVSWYTARESDARSALRRMVATGAADAEDATDATDEGGDLSLDDLTAVRVTYLLSDGSARDASDVAVALVERPGVAERPLVLAAIMAGWGLAMTGRTERSRELIGGVLARVTGTGTGFPFTREWLRATAYPGEFFAGEFRAAEATMATMHREAIEAGATPFVGAFAFHLGHVQRVRGRLAAAQTTLLESAAALRELDLFHHLPACLAELAHCAALLGDAEAAEALLAECEERRTTPFRPADTQIALAAAWTAAASGERSAAVDLALGAAEQARRAGQLVNEAIALHDVGRLGQPQRVAAALSTLAAQVDGALADAFARHVAALSAGDGDALDTVADTFERLGSPLLAAEAAAEAARVHRGAGRSGSAFAAAARSQELATGCDGAVTPALRAALPDHGLTNREEEVAALAAHGLSSPEIAARLFISVRTVDNHLSRTYAKLGIRGRDDLADVLRVDPRAAEVGVRRSA